MPATHPQYFQVPLDRAKPDDPRFLLPEKARALVMACAHVGSRVTCDPPPTTGDQDILVLSWFKRFPTIMTTNGWVLGGSTPANTAGGHRATSSSVFESYTQGPLNIIVTPDPDFYGKFMAATRVAQCLNLLDKQNRIMLFQAVLYGN